MNKYKWYPVYGALFLLGFFLLVCTAYYYGGEAGRAYGNWKYRPNTIPYANHQVIKEPTSYDVGFEIVKQAERAGFDVSTALRIASCESHLRYNAQNLNGAAGVYQFKPLTWAAYCPGEVMDYRANVQCFLKLYPQHPTWWECR